MMKTTFTICFVVCSLLAGSGAARAAASAAAGPAPIFADQGACLAPTAPGGTPPAGEAPPASGAVVTTLADDGQTPRATVAICQMDLWAELKAEETGKLSL